MKNSMLKKALAVILSATMMTSIMSVGSISASAAETEDTKNYYVPSEEIETTIDGTSNCVIEPTEIPTVDIVTEPTENTTTAVINTEPTEASKETYPTYPEPTNMADHTNPPTRQTDSAEDDIVNGGGGEIIDPPFENENKIYFDVESSGWKNYKNIYCHIWKADGTGEWPTWQSKKELCTKEEDGRYSFDITKTGNEIKSTDGRNYCVIFSSDAGAMTYTTVMSGSCLGDTVYITGISFESPEDSEKKTTEAAWRNNPDCGARKTITVTGNVVGTAFLEGESDETLMADFLIKYYNDNSRLEHTYELLYKLNLSEREVQQAVIAKLDANVADGKMTRAKANEILEKINVVLNSQPRPTEPVNDIVPEDAKIYFDVESSGWGNYKYVYCHIWRYDGTGTWPNWQTRKELCTKEADGRYSYTLSKTENEFRYSDGNVYGVIFSADTGAQTYEVVMNGKCIGDTVYVTGNTFESPEDSEKKVVDATWRENKDGGARKRITTTGNVIGTAFPEGYRDETLLAEYLISYYWDNAKMSELQNLFYKLVADTSEVLYEVDLMLDYDVSEGYRTDEEAYEVYNEIAKILEGVYVDYNLIHDINGDNRTDVTDVTTLQMYLAGYDVYVNTTKLDVNTDGVVDVKDVTELQLCLAYPNKHYGYEELA